MHFIMSLVIAFFCLIAIVFLTMVMRELFSWMLESWRIRKGKRKPQYIIWHEKYMSEVKRLSRELHRVVVSNSNPFEGLRYFIYLVQERIDLFKNSHFTAEDDAVYCRHKASRDSVIAYLERFLTDNSHPLKDGDNSMVWDRFFLKTDRLVLLSECLERDALNDKYGNATAIVLEGEAKYLMDHFLAHLDRIILADPTSDKISDIHI